MISNRPPQDVIYKNWQMAASIPDSREKPASKDDFDWKIFNGNCILK